MGKGFKVLVCGMCSVGKTAILEQVLYGNQTIGEEYSRTMGDVYIAVVETDRGLKEQLRLYDIQGLQEEDDFPKHYYCMADVFILVYAVDSLESFEKVNWLKKEIDKFREKKEWPIIVLGNKTDLLEERQVQSEAAQQWARIETVKLWEVTIMDRRTMMEPFVVLASKLSNHRTSQHFLSPVRDSNSIKITENLFFPLAQEFAAAFAFPELFISRATKAALTNQEENGI